MLQIHEVYLSLVLNKIIKQLWPLLEVDIQIRQTLTGFFPRASPRENNLSRIDKSECLPLIRAIIV